MKKSLIRRLTCAGLLTGLFAGMFFSAVNSVRITRRVDNEIREAVSVIRAVVHNVDRAYAPVAGDSVAYYRDQVLGVRNNGLISAGSGDLELREIAGNTGAVEIFVADKNNNIAASAYSGSGLMLKTGSLVPVERCMDNDNEFTGQIRCYTYSKSPLFGTVFIYPVAEPGYYAVFIFMPDKFVKDTFPASYYEGINYRLVSEITGQLGSVFAADIYNFTEICNWSLLYRGKPVPSERIRHEEITGEKIVKKRIGKYIYYYAEIMPLPGLAISAEKEGGPFRVLEITSTLSELSGTVFLNSVLFLVFMFFVLIFYFFYLNPFIDKKIFNRLDSIYFSLDQMKLAKKYDRIYVGSNDEISAVAEKINSVVEMFSQQNSFDRARYGELIGNAEKLPLGIAFVNQNSEITFINKYASTIGGGDSDTLSGFFKPLVGKKESSEIIAGIREVASGGKNDFRGSYRFRQGKGRNRFFEIRVYPFDILNASCIMLLLDAGGSHDIFYGSGYYGSSAPGSIAGIVANDLNNIFQITNGYCEYLLSGKRSDKEVQEILEKILETGKKADIFTRNLQVFSRPDKTGVFVPADINRITSSLLNIIHRIAGKNIEVRYEPGETELFSGDEGLIAQVVINLCVNAVEAMGKGGVLEIRTGTAEYGEGDVTAFPGPGKGNFVFCSIRDTGTGIEMDDLGEIFEPFFTTKHGDHGRGFGLAVSYTIIAEHEGFFTVRTEKDTGSVFTINLPVSAETAVSDIEAESQGNLLLSSEMNRADILLVDDEEMILSLGRVILEKEGYNVVTASSATEALSRVDKHKGRFALIITDIVMPDMSGKDFIGKVRSAGIDVPVLFISGFYDGIAEIDVRDKVLKKPFKSTELASAVKKIVGLK